jgi:signal peptidase II
MQEMQNVSRIPEKSESVIAIQPLKAALFSGVLLLVVLLDQITKMIVVKNMQLGESIPLIKDVFHFTYILNKGAAFGMLADHRWIFLILSTFSVLAITAYLIVRSRKIGVLFGISLSMIAGGGIGNMIDRIWNGEVFGSGAVIDFIDFCAFPQIWTWIFNVADAAVCVGAGLIFLAIILDEIKEARKRKANVMNVAETVVEAEKND